MTLPARLGKYEISSVLGTGGMGVVYRAFDPTIQRTVALKTIRKDLMGELSGGLAERLRSEARAAGRLNHPGIVAVYDYEEDADIALIAMEFVEGSSLYECLQGEVPLPLPDAVSVTVQLLDALGYAHAQGIVHRDVKPANIILTRGGRLKLADFGLARTSASPLTQSGVRPGTPAYMAPEQILGSHVDSRADLFSTGVVCHEMMTGVTPFSGPSAAVAYKICNEPTRPISVFMPTFPTAFEGVLIRALEKNADDRFQTSAEFSYAITDACRSALKDSPSPYVSGATLLRDPRNKEASSAPTLTDIAASSKSSIGPVSLSLWPMRSLVNIERQLALFIGPIAKYYVKHAATQTDDVDALYSRLAEYLDTEEARRAFMAGRAHFGAAAAKEAGSIGAIDKTEVRGPASSISPGGIPHDLVARAAAELAPFVGPIAGILAKKAAKRVGNLRDLYAALAEEVSETERPVFLRHAPPQ